MEEIEQKEVKKPSKLSKKEIVFRVAEVTDMNQKDVEIVMNALTSIIIAELQVGREITLPGLGTFSKKRKPERIGINPTTNEKLLIPARNVAKFKPAKNLKDAVGLTE